jgi:hypothetical protein
MPEPHKRRWLQFGLRTCLVFITIIAVGLGWLAWNVRTVQQRAGFRKQLSTRRDGTQIFPHYEVANWDLPRKTARVSKLRKWLGDSRVGVIRFPHDAPQSDLDAAAELFPEAHIDRWVDLEPFLNPTTQ